MPTDSIELTILMPCLNEALTLATCIDKARAFLDRENIVGEILIADNGSTDGSQEIAIKHGARVIPIERRGYGAALIGGIKAAQGRYIIMGDADDSYDFLTLMPFVTKLREGYELVMGNRFKGGIKPGAMPFLNKYLGNPVLTMIGRILFRSPIRDFHCGLRGFNKNAILDLHLQTEGMEFASEMVVKATLNHLKITEVPTTLSPDGRNRPPHLRSWRDGWRHLRFLLIFSPRWLFLYPGIILALSGLLVMFGLYFGPITLSKYTFDIHTMLFAGVSVIVGCQAIFFALFAKVFAINTKLIPRDTFTACTLKVFSLERGIILGLLITLISIIGSFHGLWVWREAAFGALEPTQMMRSLIPSVIGLSIGVQLIFVSFFLSILNLQKR